MKQYILLVMVILCAQRCFSQTKNFEYRRKISAADSDGWCSLTLPADIFKNLNKDFSDLRIYKLSEKDTIESPYVLKVRQQEVKEEVLHPSAFNSTKKGKQQFFTFELPKDAQVNFIDLSFNETNFDGFVTIEGSNDQREWFAIERRQRIISIVNQNINFNSGAIHFDVQRFRYLRTRIEADKILTLKEATLKNESILRAQETKTELAWVVESDKKAKQTIIKIDLKNYQPVVKLIFEAKEEVDYYRAFRLEQISDSANSPKGWQYFYSTIAQGYLTSLDSNRFTFDYALTKKMRVVIDDADNAPLHIKSISLFSPKVELIARMAQGDNYLFYGNRQLNPPSYDVVNYENKIPSTVQVLALADPEKLTPEKTPVSALIQNKIWLWVLMGVVIAVLGFFTVRMMKDRQ